MKNTFRLLQVRCTKPNILLGFYRSKKLIKKWVQTTIVNQLNSHERENDKKYYGKMSSLDGSSLTHTELVNIFHQNFRIDPLGH